ncbi:hypothetical protein F2P81_022693 [Scophthalmus maximus]|uniref:Uncharacterized protein n=1 Tax=Scophthalmus maximus TaxID=52904 RepID=A0A6A4S3A1_SCOMX|nr:hypothetical protein F2P81_022693 [Scophthalmus maximus]
MIATFTSLLCNMLPVNHERSVRFPPVFRPRCDLLDLFYFTMQRLFFFCSFIDSHNQKLVSGLNEQILYDDNTKNTKPVLIQKVLNMYVYVLYVPRIKYPLLQYKQLPSGVFVTFRD